MMRMNQRSGPDFLSYMLEAEPHTYKEVVSSKEAIRGRRLYIENRTPLCIVMHGS